MSPRKQTKISTPVQSIKHKDRRANIPTEELRDFVVDDEATPKTMLYPRDPSLDPQLVWKGKTGTAHSRTPAECRLFGNRGRDYRGDILSGKEDTL